MKVSLKTFMPIIATGSLIAASCGAQSKIQLATENCLKQADLDSAAYRKIFNSTIAAKDSDKVEQFNRVAADMKSTFNEIDRILTDEGISSKEYKM